MAFVHLGGEAGAKPTYFEVYAADKLAPSLKAAVIYALAVLGQRHPRVQQLLAYEDEVFAAVSALLDYNALLNLDATFSESLYGLKRQPAPRHNRDPQPAQQQQQQQQQEQQQLLLGVPVEQQLPGRLTPRARWLTLLTQVGLPYLKAKADKLYAAHAPRSVLGLAMSRAARQQQQQQQQPGGGPPLARLRRLALRGFLAAYPYVHAAAEAAKFACQLMYLLEAAEVHHPVLALLQQRIVRVSGAEMAMLEKDKERRRQQQLAAARRAPPVVAGLRRGWHYLATGFSDHARTVIIGAVFGYKVLEWWFNSAEERLAANKALPPPPPPPPPHPHPQGVPLPADVSLCPLCRRPRTNPALLAVSGYAFCYPCIFSHVTEHHTCPVTLAYADLDHVRKLYEAM